MTIVSITGAGAGRVSRYAGPVFRSADNVAVEPSGTVSRAYIHHVLTHLSYVMQTMRTGVAQPHLDKSRALGIEIPLPPLDVQTRIAAELDALEETKRGLLKAAELARRAMRATLDARLGATPIGAGDTESVLSDMDTSEF